MDMTGQRFDKWTVIGMTKIYRARKNRTACNVRCDCGNEAIREPDRLRSGRTKGCSDCAIRGAKPGAKPSLRKPAGYAAMTNRYGQYRRSATRKNLVFELTRDEVVALLKDNCYYCGDEPTTRLKSDWDEVYANGIDRIDSSTGYVTSNVVTACWVCNSAKKNMTQEDFYSWVKKVAARHG